MTLIRDAAIDVLGRGIDPGGNMSVRASESPCNRVSECTVGCPLNQCSKRPSCMRSLFSLIYGTRTPVAVCPPPPPATTFSTTDGRPPLGHHPVVTKPKPCLTTVAGFKCHALEAPTTVHYSGRFFDSP